VGVALDDRAVTLTLAVTAAGGAASPRPGDLAISLSAGRDRAALAHRRRPAGIAHRRVPTPRAPRAAGCLPGDALRAALGDRSAL